MANAKTIKTVFDRIEKTVTSRPEVGQRTAISKARIDSGLTCQIEEGPWKMAADLDQQFGGDGTAPTPSMLGRAALGSCLAMGYVIWAARLEVPLSAVEVQIQADYDVRGKFGLDDIPAGYTAMHYVVTVESPAPEHEILRVLDMADANSPNLDVFNRPQQLCREVRIAAPEA